MHKLKINTPRNFSHIIAIMPETAKVQASCYECNRRPTFARRRAQTTRVVVARARTTPPKVPKTKLSPSVPMPA